MGYADQKRTTKNGSHKLMLMANTRYSDNALSY